MPQRSTHGTASATAATRTHFLRQIAATRMRTPFGRVLDGDNPVMSEVERQFTLQAIDQGRAVLVQERDEANRSFLRVSAGERQRPRADVLASQRVVAPLRRL